MAAVAAAGFAAWYFYQPEKKSEKFETATVKKGDIEEIVTAIGNIQPFEYVDVGTQVTGQLKRLHVSVGAMVKKGDLLAEIDPTLLMSKAQATRATLRSLEAQHREKVVLLRLSELTHQRNQDLYVKGAASEEALQQGAAAMEQARTQAAALRAQIEQTESQLKGDETNLLYTKFYAPMSGTVVSLTAKEGQTLVASQQTQTILRIANLETMTVWAQVSEADVPKILIGMPAYFNTLGLVDRRWEGTVRQILPTPEVVNDVVLYNVLFDARNPDGALKTKMSAQVYFVSGRAEDTPLVPLAALKPLRQSEEGDGGETEGKAGADKDENNQTDADGAQLKSSARTYSTRVLENGKPRTREVKVGLMNRVSAQVLSGLNEGDLVVIGVEKKQKK